MILCDCCRTEIAALVVMTPGGEFVSPYGICRACWRRATRPLRRALIGAIRTFAQAPHIAEAMALYRCWQAVRADVALMREIAA